MAAVGRRPCIREQLEMNDVLDESGSIANEEALEEIVKAEGAGRVYWEMAHLFPFASDRFVEYIERSSEQGCERAKVSLQTALERRARLG